jgi:dihydropteroate synthase
MFAEEYGLDLDTPRIMGILNVTPDSFADGGKYVQVAEAVEHALLLVRDGADIIDIGGESSRPGSDAVTADEELRRVLPVIEAVRRRSSVLLSIDTCKALVAEEALRSGVNWINDISALRNDPEMRRVIKKWNCPVILMHMLGSPKTMQDNPSYHDIVAEINLFFSERIRFCRENEIHKIIVDPGIGFGKRLEDNLVVLQQLAVFKCHEYPLAIGTSRKSFLGAITGQPVENRLAGTLASAVWSVLQGVSVIRTHDVAATRDVLAVTRSIAAGKPA